MAFYGSPLVRPLGQVPAMPAESAGLHLRHRWHGFLQCAGDPLLCAGGAGGVCGMVLVGRVCSCLLGAHIQPEGEPRL